MNKAKIIEDGKVSCWLTTMTKEEFEKQLKRGVKLLEFKKG